MFVYDVVLLEMAEKMDMEQLRKRMKTLKEKGNYEDKVSHASSRFRIFCSTLCKGSLFTNRRPEMTTHHTRQQLCEMPCPRNRLQAWILACQIPYSCVQWLSAKLRYTDTAATDMLYNTANGQKIATSQCQSLTSRHVKMLGCGKFLSVGGEFVVHQVVELL